MPDEERPSAASEITTVRAVITGRVQGVGYRQFAVGRARSLNLTGSARNLEDGSVEVRARGPRDSLEKLIELLRRGPALSKVTDVRIDWGAYVPDQKGFGVEW